MAETVVKEFFPLAGRSHRVADAQLTARNAQNIGILRGEQSNAPFKGWFKDYFSMDCPAANQVARSKKATVYWRGPDWLYLVFEQQIDAQKCRDAVVQQQSAETGMSFVDASDYFCFIRLESSRIFDVLAQGSPFDWRGLAVGDAICTHFLHVNILVDHVEANIVDIMVRSSFAEYFWDHLVFACDQLGASVPIR